MIDFITAAWFGVIGACIGSFLNVVAYRLPRGISVVWKPSHCPRCGHAVRWYDNVPVFGWISLRGRCRDCGLAIAPRYAIVEAMMGATFFALAYIELFSGGATLPGGPLASGRGAWETVWNPNWPLLGWYAMHASLISIVVATVLMRLDGAISARRCGAIVAIVVALVALPYAAPFVAR